MSNSLIICIARFYLFFYIFWVAVYVWILADLVETQILAEFITMND